MHAKYQNHEAKKESMFFSSEQFEAVKFDFVDMQHNSLATGTHHIGHAISSIWPHHKPIGKPTHLTLSCINSRQENNLGNAKSNN